jgi:hypothetical protein
MQYELRSHHGRLLPVLFAALWVLTLLLVAPAFAQDQYDCASFGSQESAQAELERDPSDPSNLDADDDAIACEELASGTGEGAQGTDSGDLDCADFATQAEAQAEFDADPSDPNGLDADNDRIACEELSGAAGTDDAATGEGANGADRESADAFRCESFLKVVRDDGGGVRHQYRDDELIVRRFEQCLSEDVLKGTIVNRKLPDTGGPPLLIPWAVVLVGAGILVARRW